MFTTFSPSTAPAPHHCFSFNEKDVSAHVVLHPLHDQPIGDFTIDFSYRLSKITSAPHLFSYAAPERDNELLIAFTHAIYGHSSGPSFPIHGKELNVFHRVTMTLKNTKVLMYWDRELIAEKQVKKYVLVNGGAWVLGQEQDEVRGGFDPTQRVIGSICDFRMWNAGLDKNGVKEFFKKPDTITVDPIFDSPPTYRYEKQNGAY